MRIGFVGLGIMGLPMAANVRKAGYEVTVYDVVPERCHAATAFGASQASSLNGLAHVSDAVITMLPDAPDVEAVVGELAKGLAPGATVIEMSTISPSASVALAARLRARGINMIDAPVSGGEPGARQASLTIMVGGALDVFERCRPLFETMGSNVVHAGANGCGLKTKLVNQVVGALNLLGAVEGLRLATAASLDPAAVLKVVAGGAAGSWMLANLGPKMLAGDFAPGFSLRLQQKDLRLALEFISETGLEAPGTELTFSLVTRALEAGLGEQGNQGLINLWKA